ncbi:hypothetical protein ACIPY3_16655 [Paenarthrobacter sp. NPDC089714]|uniref:hypothetical protein n=1 Tax=Paenarthrobacter sp. NPDC089714 TaxID=3364377 RepID=UPI003812C318
MVKRILPGVLAGVLAGAALAAVGPASSSAALGALVAPPPAAAPTACVPSGSGTDYQVGPNSGQLPSLDKVPWEALKAGDTVRIFDRADPYRGKILIPGTGTQAKPIRVCGVKGPTGHRPVIDGSGAIARRGLSYVAASLDNIQETRAVIMIDRLGTQDWWQAAPSYVQVDGLEVRGAKPGNTFTNSLGKVQGYTGFGACIWIERGQNITIADNEIHDCTNGVSSRSTSDNAKTVTSNIRISRNYIYGNGVVGSEGIHNTYTESSGVIYEYNRFGPLRVGALGNAIKDRSSGTVVRYNSIEGGAHSIDLVEAEDFFPVVKDNPAYRTTYVYGNQIRKNGPVGGSVIHYGGDHYGAAGASNWGESLFRKGILYFWHNTVVVSNNESPLFNISTTKERAEVWNNVFAFSGVTYPTLRQVSDVDPSYTAGGVINLGVNWADKALTDNPWRTLPGTVNGWAGLVRGTGVPVDSGFVPLAGSTVLNRALTPVSVASVSSAYPVDRQLGAAYLPISRTVIGTAPDLGARER